MKNKLTVLTALLLALCLLFSLTACGKSSEPDAPKASAEEVFTALLNNAAFETPLEDSSESAGFTYAELPEGAVVTMYTGDARYADELTWIT